MSALYAARQALLEERAREMRHRPTLSEQLLWSAMRGARLGVTSKRQRVLEPFIVDFLSPALKLIVEIDGDAYHATRVKADARDRKLERAGYTVLRIPASIVERNLGRAIELVRDVIERTGGRKNQ